MATKYTIIVKNQTNNNQNFFFFQEPATYVGGPTVYSNSLYQNALRPEKEGAELVFEVEVLYFAGVQERMDPPVVGEPSGRTNVIRPVELTPATGAAKNNAYDMLINPLGLKGPLSVEGVQKGAFRIKTAEFNPNAEQYNVGLGVKGISGNLLSNFIEAEPQKNVDIQPVVIFYVQTGSYQAGDVVNFTSSSAGAAVCDATDGTQTFRVNYTLTGGWEVNGTPMQGLTSMIKKSA